jgi:hypothetical protein
MQNRNRFPFFEGTIYEIFEIFNRNVPELKHSDLIITLNPQKTF